MLRIMIDMSATLLHHGHIRLIQNAKTRGTVVVGLTTDKEIEVNKGYKPELSFEERRDVLLSIRGVDEVVATPWHITSSILEENEIDFLLHGDDNANDVPTEKLLIVPRTPKISSSKMRENSVRAVANINNKKLMLTPGPAVVLHENLSGIKPFFGRGDDEYTHVAKSVTNWIRTISGQDNVITAQGSATFGLELAAHSFVAGKVLLISTGYYSDRLERLLPLGCNVKKIKYEQLNDVSEKYDWVVCAYTETSTAFLSNLRVIRDIADNADAKLFVDATGSIGLEKDHALADVMAFSSCKGLFGLTGASFIAHKAGLEAKNTDKFYFNIETHKHAMVTGPYHAIASLYNVIALHAKLRQRVEQSKKIVSEKFGKFIDQKSPGPLLCTYVSGEVVAKDDHTILYSPRSNLPGSVICHLGEIHMDENFIENRINVVPL